MHSRIVLVGFPGSGKSTIGKKLAKQLDYRFVDLDQEIEKRVQLSIPAIFEQFGENQFRIWEQTQLQETLQLEKVVIATGGGTPCFYQNMELITQHSEAVYIQVASFQKNETFDSWFIGSGIDAVC
jgi:shikimate kinase